MVSLDKKVARLPNSFGVYVFKNSRGQIIYIGKSNRLRQRVRSHFTSAKRYQKDAEMMQEVVDIDFIEAAGELGALIQELVFVRKYKPRFNHMLKGKQYSFVVQKLKSENGYDYMGIKEADKLSYKNLKNSFGVFSSKISAKEKVEELISKHQLCPQIGRTSEKKACFSYQIKKCKGACIEKEPAKEYNDRFDKAFKRYGFPKWAGGKKIIKESRGKLVDEFAIKDWKIIDSTVEVGELINKFDYELFVVLNKFF